MPWGLLNRGPVPAPSTDPVAPGVPAIVVTRPPAVTFRIVWFPESVTNRSPPRAAIPPGNRNCAAGPVPSADPGVSRTPARVLTVPAEVTLRIVWFPVSVTKTLSPPTAPPPAPGERRGPPRRPGEAGRAPRPVGPPRPRWVAGEGGRAPCRRHLADDVISRVRHDKQAAPSRGRSDPRRAADQRRLPRAFRDPGGPREARPGRHHAAPWHRPAGVGLPVS